MAKEKHIIIEDSVFFRSLVKRSKQLYFTKSGKLRKKLNSRDLYQREILETCLRINALINNIKLSRAFIKERRGIADDSDLSVKNGDFIRYHLETFYLKISSFNDLILKLINRTYNFGFQENIGLEKRIRKAAKSNEEIEVLLEGLDIIVNSIKSERNEIAHGGYHGDPQLILIESSSLIPTNEETKRDYDITLDQLLVRSMSNIYAYELMLTGYSKLIFHELLPTRRSLEKKLLNKKS